MASFAAAGRIASTLVAMVGTRLELAAVEFQEDARRLLGYLAWTLLAVFLAAGAVHAGGAVRHPAVLGHLPPAGGGRHGRPAGRRRRPDRDDGARQTERARRRCSRPRWPNCARTSTTCATRLPLRTRRRSMNKPTLAARRAELVERCAEQRTGLAYELQALRPSAVLRPSGRGLRRRPQEAGAGRARRRAGPRAAAPQARAGAGRVRHVGLAHGPARAGDAGAVPALKRLERAGRFMGRKTRCSWIGKSRSPYY